MATNKTLAVQLNKQLDGLGITTMKRQRVAILSKILDIPRQDAWSLLDGNTVSSTDVLKRVAVEFDIDVGSRH